jgi:hypothetical protein
MLYEIVVRYPERLAVTTVVAAAPPGKLRAVNDVGTTTLTRIEAVAVWPPTEYVTETYVSIPVALGLVPAKVTFADKLGPLIVKFGPAVHE